MVKLQSAMEYLMTYGWAILVIAVVLGAFYQLGIFGSSPTQFQPSCLASAGFLCQNPTLNSSGYLGVKFGQIGISSITVTNLACTSNVTAPSTTNSVNLQLVSGATAILAFSCPLASNSIGSGFKGYLWLTYSTPTQSGIVDRIVVVTARVMTSGNVIAVLGGGPSALGSSSNFIYCIAGYLFNNVYYAPIYSNGNLGAWATTNSYPLSAEGPPCTVSGGYVYCEGAWASGYFSTSYSAPIYSTGGLGSWTATTSYPYAYGESPYSVCSSSGGYIYCMGGYDGSSYKQQTYYATLSSGTVGSWTAGSSLPVGKASSCPMYNGDVYCVGGYEPSSYTSDVYYSAVSGASIGAWSTTTTYPTTMGSMPCVTSGGYIYCIAGYTGTTASSLSYYASISSGGVGAWASTTAYPIAAYGFTCAIKNGYVYCVGSDTGGGGVTNVYYAPISSTGIGSWIAANSYPLSSRYTTCVSS